LLIITCSNVKTIKLKKTENQAMRTVYFESSGCIDKKQAITNDSFKVLFMSKIQTNRGYSDYADY